MHTGALASSNVSISNMLCQGDSLLANYEQTDFAKTLQNFFDTLEDEDLLTALKDTRRVGRLGYSLNALWRTYILGYYLNIPTITGLIRELTRNPCLAYLCEVESAYDIPTPSTYCRFGLKLARFNSLIEESSYKQVRNLMNALPDFGEEWAIDSTAIHAYSRPRKAMLSDPEAGWGYEKDRYGNKRKYYGYKAHIIADAHYEIPLSLVVTPANIYDSIVAPYLITRTKECTGIIPSYIIADPGYDTQAIHELIVGLGAAPIIKANPRHYGIAGNLEYRLYPKVPRDPIRWQEQYNKRTAVERVNSRLKEFVNLDNLRRRGLDKVQLHGYLAMMVMQAKALINV
ncbi:MAG: transposase [Halobacteriota archaeon]|nr:transposase [Halobacteriota archaeon]